MAEFGPVPPFSTTTTHVAAALAEGVAPIAELLKPRKPTDGKAASKPTRIT